MRILWQFFNTRLTRENFRISLELGEVIGNVAAFTLLAESAIMDIPVGMATITRKRHVKFLFHGRLVAIQTAGFQVGAIKFVLGAPIMIKVP